jgi:hypothetical protein
MPFLFYLTGVILQTDRFADLFILSSSLIPNSSFDTDLFFTQKCFELKWVKVLFHTPQLSARLFYPNLPRLVAPADGTGVIPISANLIYICFHNKNS